MFAVAPTGLRCSLVALVTLLALTTIVAASGCGGGGLPPETLVQERCTECHTLAPIEAIQKTRQEWQSTVYRMIEKGADLGDREAQEVIDYLSETYGVEAP